ncbi:Fatty acid hydroxylase [Corchorus olitorius]|uniref:Fatty acid hydroxylase n=1 Tax=Corchorus olitorius TaxID=93759 RepID=A0A1R3KRI7_9ROSI|nr:Fatty acid hydroxylase [Corchorus olitorius]
MVFWERYVSDEAMGTFAPIVVYWLYAGIYQLLPPMDKYRLHTRKEEEEKNSVPLASVVKGVLLQQVVQATVAQLLFLVSNTAFLGTMLRITGNWHLAVVVQMESSMGTVSVVALADEPFCMLMGRSVLLRIDISDSIPFCEAHARIVGLLHNLPIAMLFYSFSPPAPHPSLKDTGRAETAKSYCTFSLVPLHIEVEPRDFIYLLVHEKSDRWQLTSTADASGTTTQPSILVQLVQIIVAMFVMDTWQYFVHRYMHQNKFLYRHVHSQHHRLVVPYAIGALYNHPLEGLLLDTFGGALSFLVSGMTARTAVIFFCFAVIKTVDDHCGLWLPGNIFHIFFQNNSAYHDIHHQLQGTKYNYSQPFFPIWDKLLGTHMPYVLLKRPEGGFEARLKKTSCILLICLV